MNILTKITANGIDFKVGNPTLVTWDSTKNMNDFKTQGVYEIYGERTVKTDNLPITNEGDGHSIAARLTVVASTLQPANNEICVTQFLQLSNRIGGEGSTYVRTYNENNNSMNGWSPWQKQMGMVETYMSSDTLTIDVDNMPIGDGLNGMIDNCMYSGIYSDCVIDYTGTGGSFDTSSATFLETFILVVINDYDAMGKLGMPGHITQLKYAVDAITGQSTVKKRVGTGNDINTISWGDWTEIGGGSNDVDVTAIYTTIAEEKARAEQAEQAIEAKALDASSADYEATENTVALKFATIEGIGDEATIPAATTEKAGVMTAEDKKELTKITKEIEKIKDGDAIVGQAREIHSRNGKNVTASFLARTTAGSGTIGDGRATLKSVGGNIVKNLVDGTFMSGWTRYGTDVTIDINNNVMHIVASKSRVGVGYTLSGISGASYIIGSLIKVNSGSIEIIFGNTIQKTSSSNEWQFVYSTGVFSSATGVYIRSEKDAADFYATNPIVINLTEMFGAGNEPTIEECDKIFGTMGVLPQGLTIANPKEFKSTGYNQADPNKVLVNKGIENGAIVDKVDSNIVVVPCLPCKIGVGENNGYHIHGEFGEDIKVYLTPLNPMEITGELYMHELAISEKGTYVPQIKGYMIVEVPTTANLCAHFLWSEDCDKNDYEPYYDNKIELPRIPEMSEYGLVGIQSSGTLACDEIDFVKGVYRKKIGAVDMGSFDWSPSEGYFFCKGLTNLKKPTYGYVANAITDKYTVKRAYDIAAETIDNNRIMIYSGGQIYVKDVEYTTASDFKSAMQGVMLYYELDEPIEYPLSKIDNNYTSSDYGVEQFDSKVPCNANNLYYMRSLAGETRNFLDRMYANTDKTDANEVADYITNNLGGDITAEETDSVVSNIEESVVSSALRKTPQVLTESEKLQARENIDAQKELTLTIKDNGNIVIGNIQGETKEFMPATPSGDPLHYAYIAAGADYNNSGADITKTAPWGETVTHKTGHYYLNGLGDITEEQMMEIYNAGEFKLNIGGFYTNNKKIRTFIPAKISGQEGYGAFNISGILCNATSVESVVFTESYNLAEKCGIAITSSIPYASFSGCSKLVYIQNINLSTTTNLRDSFKNCNNLVYAKLNGLKCNLDWSYSKDISQDSVLYTIQNAVPTSAITITLHHDAYTRLTSDQEVLDALTEKNAALATEDKGGKISLVCAVHSEEIIPNN